MENLPKHQLARRDFLGLVGGLVFGSKLLADTPPGSDKECSCPPELDCDCADVESSSSSSSLSYSCTWSTNSSAARSPD